MNQYEYDEMDEYCGMSEEDIDWLTTNHSAEEWKDYSKKQLIKQGYKEHEIEEYYDYVPEKKCHVPNKKLEARWDSLRKIAQMMKNLYSEALRLDVGNSFDTFYQEALQSVGIEEPEIDMNEIYEMFPHLLNSDPDEDEYMEDCSDVPQQTYEEFEKSASALDRIQFLANRGLSIDDYNVVNYFHYDNKHTVDGIEYIASNLYHIRDEVGIYYDEHSECGKYVPHERHVEELLKIARKGNIPLLLIYWEQEDKPIWEIYINGKLVRQQSEMYSYEGYVYDQKMMSRMAELKDADIGSIQKALMELNAEARKIFYEEEMQIRVAENDEKHAELAQIVTKMQEKYQQLGFVFNQVDTHNDELDEASHKSVCAALDSFADTIAPGLAASAYEEKAKKIYPFYPDVAPSSQRYLRTAVALEEHLTAEHYDICPLYFELCRVFENELDVRIFSEYISKLVSIKDTPVAQWGGKEYCFKKIQELVSNAQNPTDRVFVPEKIKITALHKVNNNINKASVYQTILLDMLRAKKYKVDLIEKESDFHSNCSYVEKRNKYVHPDDSLDAVALQEELEKIKRNTIKRLDWLLKATKPTK